MSIIMRLQLPQDPKNRGLLTHISFNPDPTTSKKYDENQDSPKVEINTQMGETNRKAVSIYVLILNTGNSKALLKLLILINKIPTALCYDQEYPFQRVPLFF